DRSEEDMLQRSWCYAAPLVQRMPDTVIQEIAHGVTGWIEVVSGTINRHKGILLDCVAVYWKCHSKRTRG
ncbi:hypothetical protein, partial [Thiolapillus sp.]|uniref:hypothetical protein n=1 Tax=Thiolapillus sp. TaxID=2017437 RepID=UPI003AF62DD1